MKCAFLIVLSLGSTLLCAQKPLTKDQAKEDLTFIYKKMLRIHPGLYRYQDSTAYRETYVRILRSLPDTLPYFDFFRKINPLISQVEDLHTGYGHSKSWQKRHKNRPPFILSEINHKVIVAYSASKDSNFVRGMEVLEIDNEPIQQVLSEIEGYIGLDKGNRQAKRYYALRSFSGLYQKYISANFSVKISVKPQKSDSVITFTLPNIPKEEFMPTLLKKYPDKTRKNLNYSLIDSNLHLGKIDISSFVYKKKPWDFIQLGFKKKLKKHFKAIQKDSVESLIIDLRGNGGGFIPNVNRLLRFVSHKPFRLLDTMSFKREATHLVFPPYLPLRSIFGLVYFNKKNAESRYHLYQKNNRISKHAFRGDLYVLVDAGVYSAGIMAISLLNDMDRATFVGTEPAGASWGSYAGEWYDGKLPNSRIRLHIPKFKLVHAIKHKSEHPAFLEPDLAAESNMDDFNNGRDCFVDSIKENIRLRYEPEFDQ